MPVITFDEKIKVLDDVIFLIEVLTQGDQGRSGQAGVEFERRADVLSAIRKDLIQGS